MTKGGAYVAAHVSNECKSIRLIQEIWGSSNCYELEINVTGCNLKPSKPFGTCEVYKLK
jgi:hypothetical protein